MPLCVYCVYINYNMFSLLAVVIFYKVSENTELVNTESFIILRENTGLGSCELLAKTFSSANQYITLFYECFCLKMPYLIYIDDSLILNYAQKHSNSCLDKVYLTHLFLYTQSHHCLLVLKNIRQHFTTILGCHVRKQNNQQKHKNVKNMALNSLRKEHFPV